MSLSLRTSVIKLERIFEQSVRQFERRESSAELEKLPRGYTIECNDCSAQARNTSIYQSTSPCRFHARVGANKPSGRVTDVYPGARESGVEEAARK
jgi:hypothetical protein